jgi:hypothetical protein
MLRRTTFSGRPEQPEKALPQRPDDRHTKEHPGFVYAGAAAAFAVVVPISAVSPAPPQLALFLVAAPCLVGAIVLLWTWVAHGHLPAGLVAIGVAVLLLNLAAAGGIGFAGVGGSLWLLIALGLTLAEADDGRWLPGWTAFTLLAGAVAVAFACYATGYGPVLRSQSLIRLAQTHPRQMENYLLEAANDDPLSAEPWSQLAAIAFAEWSASPTSDSLRRFNLYTAEMLRRAPNSSAAWQTAGDRAFQVYGRTGQSPALEGAEIAMRKAAELYPNSAVNRAKLAIVLRAAGKEADYEAERRSALRLDELTPHLDKKLPAELRKSLQRTSIPAMK